MYHIYGFDACPWCKKAKQLLEEENIDHRYIDIPTPEDRTRFLDERGFLGPDRTFPRIYKTVDSKEILVGGFASLEMDVLLR